LLLRQLPNLVSATRFLLTPFAVRAVIAGDDRTALWLCLLGGATDFLDGGLARRLGETSRSGAILDPLADKFMLNAIYLALWLSRGEWLGAVVIARDVLILAGSAALFLATRRKDFPPSWLGKISTTIQIGWVVALFIGMSEAFKVFADGVLLAGTVASGLDYFRRGLNMFRQDGKTPV
jgi:cardiolipin synthase